MSARVRLLQSAAGAAAIAFVGLFAVRQVGSPDAGWHVRTGRDILAEHALPQLDRYTYTVGDHANIATGWAYDVALAGCEHLFGAAGLTLASAVLVMLAFALVARTARAGLGSRGALALLLLLGGVACEERFEVRPELVSWVFFAATLSILERRALGQPVRLWTLAVVSCLWANFHSLYLVGWGAMGCFVAGTWLSRRRLDVALIAWCAAAAAATLAHPYGWRALAQNLSLWGRLGSSQAFSTTIAEYASPFSTLADVDHLHLHLVPLAAFLVYLALVLGSLPALCRERRWASVLLALMTGSLALAMERNIPLFVLATIPGTLAGLSPVASWLEKRVPQAVRKVAELAVPALALTLVLVGALRIVNDAYYVGRGRLERFGLGWNPFLLPVDAAQWVRSSGLSGRMLNHLNFGGHLSLELGGQVYADGRLEVMGEDFYRSTLEAFASLEGLERAVQDYGCAWLIVPYQVVPELIGPLGSDARWKLVYFDHLAAIYVRTESAQEVVPHERVRALAGAAPALDLTRLPGLDGTPRPGALRRWIAGLVRRQTYPVEAYFFGVFHYLRGDMQRLALDSAQAIRESDGGFQELYGNLGSALYDLGDLPHALACLRIAEEELPLYARQRRETFRQMQLEIARELAAQRRSR